MSSVELLNLLRRIADHDNVPDTVQADARDYLDYLSGCSWGVTPNPRRVHAGDAGLDDDIVGCGVATTEFAS